MIGTQRVIVSMTPDALDGAVVVRSRVARTATVELDRRQWRDAWGEGLIAFDEALQTLFRQLKVGKGARVSVIAPSPTSVLDVSAMTGSESAAVQAARLRISERLDAHSAVSTVDSVAIAYDEWEGADRTHVLSVAEDDRSAQAVMGWVARAQGRLEQYVTRPALAIAQLIEQASEHADETAVWCLVDRTCSVVAALEGGRLLCVRAVEVGHQSLAEAYARGLAVMASPRASSDGEEQALDMARASRLLFEHGVPARDAKIGSMDSPYRRDVAPLLAPVIQRLSIEIKQTIRFGVVGGERQFTSLRLIGTGSSIPGLATLLTESTELHVHADASHGGPDGFDPGTCEHAFATGHGPDLQLLPVAAIERMRASRRLGAIRTGVFAAAGLLAIEGGLIALDRGLVFERREQQQAQLQLTRDEAARRDRAQMMADELGLASYASAAASGEQPDWYAVLAETAALTDDTVSLREFRAYYEGTQAMLALEGIATDAQGERSGGALGRFMDGLKRSPLIARVELGSTSVGSSTASTRFRLRCAVQGFPLAVRDPELFVGPPPKPEGGGP